ncbi:Uncharacterised protein [Lelliottia amnigena]|nr:hypothetical protein CCAJJPOJ_02073 [Lelliottia sp. T2.26D-8]VDZ87933.1 Uncharacterised protein [Lelliottia amnigena]
MQLCCLFRSPYMSCYFVISELVNVLRGLIVYEPVTWVTL